MFQDCHVLGLTLQSCTTHLLGNMTESSPYDRLIKVKDANRVGDLDDMLPVSTDVDKT